MWCAFFSRGYFDHNTGESNGWLDSQPWIATFTRHVNIASSGWPGSVWVRYLWFGSSYWSRVPSIIIVLLSKAVFTLMMSKESECWDGQHRPSQQMASWYGNLSTTGQSQALISVFPRQEYDNTCMISLLRIQPLSFSLSTPCPSHLALKKYLFSRKFVSISAINSGRVGTPYDLICLSHDRVLSYFDSSRYLHIVRIEFSVHETGIREGKVRN